MRERVSACVHPVCVCVNLRACVCVGGRAWLHACLRARVHVCERRSAAAPSSVRGAAHGAPRTRSRSRRCRRASRGAMCRSWCPPRRRCRGAAPAPTPMMTLTPTRARARTAPTRAPWSGGLKWRARSSGAMESTQGRQGSRPLVAHLRHRRARPGRRGGARAPAGHAPRVREPRPCVRSARCARAHARAHTRMSTRACSPRAAMRGSARFCADWSMHTLHTDTFAHTRSRSPARAPPGRLRPCWGSSWWARRRRA